MSKISLVKCEFFTKEELSLKETENYYILDGDYYPKANFDLALGSEPTICGLEIFRDEIGTDFEFIGLFDKFIGVQIHPALIKSASYLELDKEFLYKGINKLNEMRCIDLRSMIIERKHNEEKFMRSKECAE